MNEQKTTWGDFRDRTADIRRDIGFAGVRESWPTAPATFTDDTLTICGHPVMERWEENYMETLARIAAGNGGHVLEVGFGMGISAGFIQREPIDGHHVIEANCQVYRRLEEFARTAPQPVFPRFGFWEETVRDLKDGSFSGILFDTYPLKPDEIHRNHFPFFAEAHRLLRPGGVLTYYSDETDGFSESHLQALQSAGFRRIAAVVCPVSPPAGCRYWTGRTILAPIITK